MSRTILHVDMDEFFAAVEKLDHPELQGKCLLIGGDPHKRGVVATASYEARRFGCHSAQPMAVAVRRCPQAIRLPGRHARYRQISNEVFEILGRFAPSIEPLSIDEAFLDCTGCDRLLGDGKTIARSIKKTIREEIGITASVGVAENKFLAKLASDLQKPDGLCLIPPDRVEEILDPLQIRKLWGVGPACEKKLHAMGIHTVGDLRKLSQERLGDQLGDLGEHLYRLARGIDSREVTADHEAKSIGQEQTFAEDVDQLDSLLAVLLSQVEHVARRLRRHDLKTPVLTLKLRGGDFSTVTRAVRLEEATNVTDELWQAARDSLKAWAACQFRPLRLLGVTAGQLQTKSGRQLSLFTPESHRKGRDLDAATDSIRKRFGPEALKRGLNL